MATTGQQHQHGVRGIEKKTTSGSGWAVRRGAAVLSVSASVMSRTRPLCLGSDPILRDVVCVVRDTHISGIFLVAICSILSLGALHSDPRNAHLVLLSPQSRVWVTISVAVRDHSKLYRQCLDTPGGFCDHSSHTCRCPTDVRTPTLQLVLVDVDDPSVPLEAMVSQRVQ